MQLTKLQRRQSGFTLLEIMIVVVIIGIFATVVIVNVAGDTHKARVVKAKSDIQTMSLALERYKMDNFSYPSTEQGLDALVNQPSGDPTAKNWKEGGYVDRLQKDPWGNPYQYLQPGEHGKFDIFSLGRDGEVGGDGENADIGNWDSEQTSPQG